MPPNARDLKTLLHGQRHNLSFFNNRNSQFQSDADGTL
jgi:hypothetical protein